MDEQTTPVVTPALEAAPVEYDNPFHDKTKHAFPHETLLAAAKDFIENVQTRTVAIIRYEFNGEETAHFRCLREAVEREIAANAAREKAEDDARAALLAKVEAF
jgi:hypothetical protein